MRWVGSSSSRASSRKSRACRGRDWCGWLIQSNIYSVLASQATIKLFKLTSLHDRKRSIGKLCSKIKIHGCSARVQYRLDLQQNLSPFQSYMLAVSERTNFIMLNKRIASLPIIWRSKSKLMRQLSGEKPSSELSILTREILSQVKKALRML